MLFPRLATLQAQLQALRPGGRNRPGLVLASSAMRSSSPPGLRDAEAKQEKHRISPEVWEARGYHFYEKGDPEGLVRRAWPQGEDNLEHGRHIASQADGLIMPRYPALELLRGGGPFREEEHIYAEIRPEEAVITKAGRYRHFHGRRRLTDEERERLIRSGVKAKHISSAWEMRRHINKSEKRGGHGGRNAEFVHWRIKKAKYVFPIGAEYAKRIDMNPLIVKRGMLEAAARVYVCLEGCLKGDSILTAILENGELAIVVSVPSVTLWGREELKR